jgi:hypothetical protein
MQAENIQITLLKLNDGTRLLRLTEPESGLSLERAIDPNQPLLKQKKQMQMLFGVTLARAETLAA